MKIQVGDLVKAQHWGTGYIGLVMSIRPKPNGEDSEICTVMMNDGTPIDQLIRDLEVICSKSET